LSTVDKALEHARKDAQALHKKIQATTAKDHAAIRANLQSSADAASVLALSLKTLAQSQQADTKQHLRDAATVLETAAKDAQAAGSASEATIKVKNTAMLARIRSATQQLSHALAEKRGAAQLVKR